MSLNRYRQTLGQVVAEELLARLRTGALSPGQRLPAQRQLMEEFGVGANTIREACQSLVAMGILDIRPGRGTVIVSASVDSAFGVDTVAALLADQAVLDLCEFRQAVEGEMAALAAMRASAEDIAAIRGALDKFRQVLVMGEPVYPADVQFHRAVAEAAHNAVFGNVLDALGERLVRARQRTESIPGTKEQALIEHQSVYDAIVRHNAPAARLAMSSHLDTVMSATSRSIYDFTDDLSNTPEAPIESEPRRVPTHLDTRG